ncbi:MAG: inositol monophosphatase family protein [Pseudomonas sp.]
MRPLFRDTYTAALEAALYSIRHELRRYWSSTLAVLPATEKERWQGEQSVHDLVCEQILQTAFASLPFKVSVFSEEATPAQPSSQGYSLLVDPLDGSHNAIYGFPAYTCSVALHDGENYIYGWVYDISRDVVYSAARGEGAYLQTPLVIKRLATSTRSDLHDLRLTFMRPKEPSAQQAIARLLWAAGKIRVLSCSSLELCLIASACLDGFIDISQVGHQRSCDIAAAELILREAGGLLLDGSFHTRSAVKPSAIALKDYGSLIALGSEAALPALMHCLDTSLGEHHV